MLLIKISMIVNARSSTQITAYDIAIYDVWLRSASLIDMTTNRIFDGRNVKKQHTAYDIHMAKYMPLDCARIY